MKRQIFTQLAPNNEFDDVREALAVLLLPWTWKRGDAGTLLQEDFKTFLHTSHAFAFESGRGSLYAILQALGIGAGDEVLLQAYTCVAVPNPVLWVGAKPVYVDCDEQSFTLSVPDCEKKITPHTKALIIQHTFGLPAALDELIACARKHNLFIIEDCAHALDAQYRGQKVGTFGDAAFWSFGRDKCISSVFGGMVTTGNDELAEKIRTIHHFISTPSMFWIAQQLAHIPISFVVKKTYTWFSLGKLLMKIAKKMSLISLAVQPRERTGGKPNVILKRLPHALAVLARHQMKKIERFNSHRKHCASLYTHALEKTSYGLPYEGEGKEHIWLRYTIRSSKRDALLYDAKKEGIYLGDWYTESIAPRGVDYARIGYNPLSCPTAEKCAKESFNLPTDIHVTDQDIERIVSFLKKSV